MKDSENPFGEDDNEDEAFGDDGDSFMDEDSDFMSFDDDANDSAEEENFFGKHTGKEPKPDRWSKPVGQFGDVTFYGWTQVSSGYAAVRRSWKAT